MLLRRFVLLAISFLALCLSQNTSEAGMPSVRLVVTEIGRRRLEEVSFFLVGFLVLTGIYRWLWNGLAKDFPVLPKLNYRSALGMMLLWGLALTVVLSLISGARELMTPAAWEPNGITHRLVSSKSVAPIDHLEERRKRLESLKLAFWEYAAGHDAQFPSNLDDSHLRLLSPM